MTSNAPQRCGYLAILGRPNAGKSTLLNAMVGDKLAVVSRRPQTTRNRILGIALQDKAQLVFLDTPGVHKAGRAHLLNTTMNKIALSTAADADVILYLVDLTRGFGDDDRLFLRRILNASSAPFMIVGSKIDAEKQPVIRTAVEKLEQELDAFFADEALQKHLARRIALEAEHDGLWLVSSKRPESVTALKRFLAALLPEGEWLFEADDLTDRSNNFICAELVREQLFRQLGDEIPYGCAVKVEHIEMKPDITVVDAVILVTRAGHKPMVLGKGGSRIRALGTAARESLERHFRTKVYLDVTVKVAEGWIDDQRLIAELAHMTELDDPNVLGAGDDQHA